MDALSSFPGQSDTPDSPESGIIHLDAEHRAATGRPISRDALRARLQIGRDRAGDLVRAVRAEAAAAAGPALQQQAA